MLEPWIFLFKICIPDFIVTSTCYFSKHIKFQYFSNIMHIKYLRPLSLKPLSYIYAFVISDLHICARVFRFKFHYISNTNLIKWSSVYTCWHFGFRIALWSSFSLVSFPFAHLYLQRLAIIATGDEWRNI